eukprot:6154033-Alexandrium_andersonii.AAC.1
MDEHPGHVSTDVIAGRGSPRGDEEQRGEAEEDPEILPPAPPDEEDVTDLECEESSESEEEVFRSLDQ